MDATLKELTGLVKEVYPEARKKGTLFSFAIVYPDPKTKMYRLVSRSVRRRLDLRFILKSWVWNVLVSHLSQAERHRQHCVGPEGSGWRHDAAVSALLYRRLFGYRHHTAKPSPAFQHTHEAFLNMCTPNRPAGKCVSVFFFLSWMVSTHFINLCV